jgi:hypothetical protein
VDVDTSGEALLYEDQRAQKSLFKFDTRGLSLTVKMAQQGKNEFAYILLAHFPRPLLHNQTVHQRFMLPGHILNGPVDVVAGVCTTAQLLSNMTDQLVTP